MKLSIMGTVFSLLLLSLVLLGQENSASGDFNVVWSLSSQPSTPQVVWNSSLVTGLPDSIIHIKNVKAGIDMDQDGKQEFMVPVLHVVDGVNRRSILVFEKTGNDHYANVWSYTFPDEASEFVTLDVSDLDGDGNQEILAVHIPAVGTNPSVLYVFENVGDNDYGTGPVVQWDLGTPGLDKVRLAKAADLDNDGKQEVVMTTFTTNPSIVIASVSDFVIPVWTTEFSDNLGTTSPDIAGLTISDMDNDGTPEVVCSDGSTDNLVVVEATGADTYALNLVPMPVAGKTVSVHGIDAVDANGDGRDEVYFANLQGAVWVVATSGDAINLTTSDIHMIDDTNEQWLEASTGDLGFGGSDFVIAASNATKAVNYRYAGGAFGDVTDPLNYQVSTVIDSADVAAIVPGGIRVYGLDLAGDMDGDGLPEIVFSRGSTRGGTNAPALFITEGQMNPVGITDPGTVPHQFALEQNYPNPFNPETNISFALPKTSHVELVIYNVLGQKVRTLVNQTLEAKVHTVKWDGRDDQGVAVPSGLYFYRLKSQQFTQTKRMLLVR